MTRIKICGLTRFDDIAAVNEYLPDYIGFVFARESRRYIPPERAKRLKEELAPGIAAVGVFVDEDCEKVAGLISDGVIDIAQLHGSEDEEYILRLKKLTGGRIIKAFRMRGKADAAAAEKSVADDVLLDSGAGSGRTFDRRLLQGVNRPYFLAGGLDCENVGEAVKTLRPYAVDVSSGVETGGVKDKNKIAAFIAAVREADKR